MNEMKQWDNDQLEYLFVNQHGQECTKERSKIRLYKLRLEHA